MSHDGKLLGAKTRNRKQKAISGALCAYAVDLAGSACRLFSIQRMKIPMVFNNIFSPTSIGI
jgi:hypothetical protein